MRVRNLVFVATAALAIAMPARAALTLEFVQVASINAAASTAPAISSSIQTTPATFTDVFVQVCLRDNLYAGPGTGTIPWQDNGGAGGAGSLGLSLFFNRFDTSSNLAFNPSPTVPANAAIFTTAYGSLTGGTMPGPGGFTNFGGILNFGFEPGFIPQQDGSGPGGRISLYNLRVRFNTTTTDVTGFINLRDQNPNAADFTSLANADPGGPNPGTTSVIDSLIFGGPAGGNGGPNVFSVPFTIHAVPEPSSMALCGLALAGFGYRKLRRKTAKATV